MSQDNLHDSQARTDHVARTQNRHNNTYNRLQEDSPREPDMFVNPFKFSPPPEKKTPAKEPMKPSPKPKRYKIHSHSNIGARRQSNDSRYRP